MTFKIIPSKISTPKILRCAIYTRVSTLNQAKRDFSTLVTQRTICEDFIRSKKDWCVLAERYDEPGISAKHLRNRPAVQRLIQDVMAGKIDVVVVYKMDRVCRNFQEEIEFNEMLSKRGILLFADGKEIEIATPSGFLTNTIVSVVSEAERRRTSDNVKDKIREAKKLGMWTGGCIPLGYDRDEKKDLIINSQEAIQVCAMYETYLKEQSIDRALKIINSKYTTKAWRTESGKMKGGKLFPKTTYFHMLSNPVYIGMIKSEGGLLPGKQKAIVGMALYENVQHLLAKNRATRKSIACNKYQYLLRSLIRCVHCGSIMTTYNSYGRGKRNYFYYKCTSAIHRGKDACPVKTVRAREIEGQILNRIKFLGETPAVIEKVVAKTQELTTIRIPEIKEAQRRLSVERRKVQEEIAQIFNGMKATGSETNRLVGLELEKLDIRERELHAKSVSQDEELESARGSAIAPKDIRQALQRFSAVFNSMANLEQVQLLNQLIQGIDYDGIKKTISLRFYPPFKRQETQAELLNLSVEPECSDWLPGLDSNQQPSD